MFEQRGLDKQLVIGNPGIRISGRSMAGNVATYAEVLRDTYGASEVWPLSDIASGITVNAFVNSARNGVLSGLTLQNTAGIVPGSLAPLSDRVNDYVNLYTSNGSTGLADIWNGNVGSMFLFGKISNTSYWNDASYDTALTILADGNNYFQIINTPTSNQMVVLRRAGGVTKSVAIPVSGVSGWSAFGISWSTTAAQVKVYYNGAQVGSTLTGIGTWSGSLSSTRTCLFADNLSPVGNMFGGWMQYFAVKFGTVWSDTDFANMYADAATAGAD